MFLWNLRFTFAPPLITTCKKAKMKTISYTLFALLVIGLASCGEDDVQQTTVTAPAEYQFDRNGASTVSFSGQTTRIQMAQELVSAMSDFDQSAESLNEMYANMDAAGNDVAPFSQDELNISTKSVRSKVAASHVLFNTNAVEGSAIKAQLSTWLDAQINEVGVNENVLAEAGVAGQIADGTSTRYISAKGLEYNQAVAKSLIGGLMLDQIVNNYLSATVLDDGDNRAQNDNGITEEAQSYTTMEHKWDEAYGYLFGTADATDILGTIGAGDSFLNKYLGRVNGDDDFSTIAEDIYNAFKLGRAAIVAKDYQLRDEQANILKGLLSQVVGVRAVYYLQQSKLQLDSNKGGAFHGLSEGFGFVYSLRFARAANSTDALFSREEVDGFISTLMGDGANGFWDITPATLDQVSADIASKFDFTLAEAAE